MGLSAFNRYRREQEAKLKAEATVSEKEIVEVVDYEEMTRAEATVSEKEIVEVVDYEEMTRAEATVSEKEIVEVVDYEEMTRAELKEMLDKKGIEYSDRDNKTTLIELLK